MIQPSRPPTRTRATAVACVAALAVAVACGEGPRESPPRAPAHPPPDTSDAGEVTRLEMRNVRLILEPGVVQHVLYLRGRERSLRPGQPVILDDPDSYRVEIEVAETAMDWGSLTALMDGRMFAGDAPLSDVRVGPAEEDDDPGTIEIKAKLRSFPPVPVEIEGILEPSEDGDLRVRTTSIQALDIGVEGLLDLFGVEAEDLLPDMEDRGVRLLENDMVLVLSKAMPPPRVVGKVARVRVERDRVVIGFGPAEEVRRGWGASRGNFLFHLHGTIRIGKMTMHGADLRVLDRDPSDPFEYSLARMQEQHVTGYVKLQMEGGLVVHAPDLDDMER